MKTSLKYVFGTCLLSAAIAFSATVGAQQEVPPPPPAMPEGPLPPVKEAMTPEKKQAIDEMLATQHIDQNWPQMVKQMAMGNGTKIKERLQAQVNGNKKLSKKGKADALAYVDRLEKPIADDTGAALLKLDVKQVLQDMGYFVYGKYLTMDEIKQMTAQYNNPVWQKMQTMQPRIAEESRQSNRGAVMAKYFSPKELHELLNLARSPVSLKLVALQPQLRDESKVYFDQAGAPALAEVSAKYEAQLKDRIASLAK